MKKPVKETAVATATIIQRIVPTPKGIAVKPLNPPTFWVKITKFSDAEYWYAKAVDAIFEVVWNTQNYMVAADVAKFNAGEGARVIEFYDAKAIGDYAKFTLVDGEPSPSPSPMTPRELFLSRRK
jgi:hypothetical protein